MLWHSLQGAGVSGKRIEYLGSVTATTTFNATLNLTSLGLEEGDLLVWSGAVGTGFNNSIRPADYAANGWSFISSAYASTTYGAKLDVMRKIVGASPDTSVSSSDLLTGESACIEIRAYRNVNTSSPTGSGTNTTNTNTVIIDAPSITPTLSGTLILVVGGGSHNRGVDTYTDSTLSNFVSIGVSNTRCCTLGVGDYQWISGSFDPPAWGFTDADSTSFGSVSRISRINLGA